MKKPSKKLKKALLGKNKQKIEDIVKSVENNKEKAEFDFCLSAEYLKENKITSVFTEYNGPILSK